MREYKKLYPDVGIGEGIPIPAFTDQPDWQADLRHWLQAFKAATGQPLAFIQLDIDWNRNNWEHGVKAMSFLRSMNIPFGIIYNAPPAGATAMTNEQWLESAKRNFVHIESEMGVMPDQVIFASWVKYPPRSVSDQSGLGEDYLVKQYLQRGAGK